MNRKTITITEQQDSWIKAQVNQGHYGNDSEYIRDVLRKEMLRQGAETEVAKLVDAAEKSGVSSKTPNQIWDEIAKIHSNTDRL